MIWLHNSQLKPQTDQFRLKTSTCHWCHVLSSESFSSQKTADLMNDCFINIKVDREERPDIDKIYMTFVQTLTGGGGWPLSVWVSPRTLTPLTGGTYFPPTSRHGMPSFSQICKSVHKIWTENASEAQHESEHNWQLIKEFDKNKMRHLNERNHTKPLNDDDTIKKESILDCYRHFESSFDDSYGGFGKRPKFPRPSIFQLLYRVLFKFLWLI